MNAPSSGANFGALAIRNHFSWVQLVFMAIVLALGAMCPPTSHAQTCMELCEQDYLLCLQAASGDPIMAALCDDRYDACLESCT